MAAKPESRKSERFGHEYIIMFQESQAAYPFYAASYNLSETGMFFKSLVELHPGSRILVKTDSDVLSSKKVPAKVVWCKPSDLKAAFRYEVGVEFLR